MDTFDYEIVSPSDVTDYDFIRGFQSIHLWSNAFKKDNKHLNQYWLRDIPYSLFRYAVHRNLCYIVRDLTQKYPDNIAGIFLAGSPVGYFLSETSPYTAFPYKKVKPYIDAVTAATNDAQPPMIYNLFDADMSLVASKEIFDVLLERSISDAQIDTTRKTYKYFSKVVCIEQKNNTLADHLYANNFSCVGYASIGSVANIFSRDI